MTPLAILSEEPHGLLLPAGYLFSLPRKLVQPRAGSTVPLWVELPTSLQRQLSRVRPQPRPNLQSAFCSICTFCSVSHPHPLGRADDDREEGAEAVGGSLLHGPSTQIGVVRCFAPVCVVPMPVGRRSTRTVDARRDSACQVLRPGLRVAEARSRSGTGVAKSVNAETRQVSGRKPLWVERRIGGGRCDVRLLAARRIPPPVPAAPLAVPRVPSIYSVYLPGFWVAYPPPRASRAIVLGSFAF